MPSWGELLLELQPHANPDGSFAPALTLDELRLKYLNLLHQKTGRNVIAYYSGWLKANRIENIDINDSDLTGFMNALKGLDFSKGLELILHTPGGSPTAAEGIVKYLHAKFGDDIRVIVPQMAMSAGTMLACATREIVMGAHSCLGPIDPQYGGISGYNILAQFQDAKDDLQKKPETKEYWRLNLEKYPVAFYYSVIDAIDLSDALVKEWLSKYMFKNQDPAIAAEKINTIVETLNRNNRSHARHFTIDTCQDIGLNVIPLESDQELQELVLSIHHAFVITIDSSTASKLIENHIGARFISNQKV